MKRNVLSLAIAMLFVAGTAFAQETPQPADGVVEAPVAPEAVVGSDCDTPCCDPCDPCSKKRMSFMTRMRDRRCCETTCNTCEVASCDPCCKPQRMSMMSMMSMMDRMRARRCCETEMACETVETASCDPCDPCCKPERMGMMSRMRARRACKAEMDCNPCETAMAMEMPEMTETAAVAPTADCEIECCKPRRMVMMRRKACCD
ncbi:MAG: hypothetical protein MK106_04890 [Mariniblastus sp.]|nr:hypothetical protein [Mariniblastus sp.]